MESIDYNILLQKAIRGVILGALTFVEKNGMLESNHFVICFSTEDPKVEIPKFLRAKYPEEMTIVLQHWFDDLVVDEDGFHVTLNFQNSPQRLYIPITAITSFSDPGAKFGFCMTEGPPDDAPKHLLDQDHSSTDKNAPKIKKDESATKVISLDKFRRPN